MHDSRRSPPSTRPRDCRRHARGREDDAHSRRRTAARSPRPAKPPSSPTIRATDSWTPHSPSAASLPVEEVAGGCFCCRLSDFLTATDALQAADPDVIFAEPVGSCLDLAATVLRPVMRDVPRRFHVAPLTVLVDPARAAALADNKGDSDLTYLFEHQLDEADILCLTKSDAGVPAPLLKGLPAHRLSADDRRGTRRVARPRSRREEDGRTSATARGLHAVCGRRGGARLGQLARDAAAQAASLSRRRRGSTELSSWTKP